MIWPQRIADDQLHYPSVNVHSAKNRLLKMGLCNDLRLLHVLEVQYCDLLQ
jgi:hypothetical protein